MCVMMFSDTTLDNGHVGVHRAGALVQSESRSVDENEQVQEGAGQRVRVGFESDGGCSSASDDDELEAILNQPPPEAGPQARALVTDIGVFNLIKRLLTTHIRILFQVGMVLLLSTGGYSSVWGIHCTQTTTLIHIVHIERISFYSVASPPCRLHLKKCSHPDP